MQRDGRGHSRLAGDVRSRDRPSCRPLAQGHASAERNTTSGAHAERRCMAILAAQQQYRRLLSTDAAIGLAAAASKVRGGDAIVSVLEPGRFRAAADDAEDDELVQLWRHAKQRGPRLGGCMRYDMRSMRRCVQISA